MGYHQAGFHVTGVDINNHPDYPYSFYKEDATLVLTDTAWLAQFDVIAASPPCPAHSTITPKVSRGHHRDDIPAVRNALIALGKPYVIENVVNAPLLNPVRLCGSAFGLMVRRHRLFESNQPLYGVACQHRKQGRVLGIYGHHPEAKDHTIRPPTSELPGASRGTRAHSLHEAQAALGINWMHTWDDLTDAIPPAYTRYLGRQIIRHLTKDEQGADDGR